MFNIINEYIDEKGDNPYGKWLDSLKDIKGKANAETWKRSRKAERVDKPEVAKKRSPVF